MGEKHDYAFEFVESMIALSSPLHDILRILCMINYVEKGIKDKIYDEIRKNLINVLHKLNSLLICTIQPICLTRTYNNIYIYLF